MILPEITSRIKSAFQRFESKPITLDLKGMSGFSPSWGPYDYARSGFRDLATVLSGDLPAWSGETVSLQTALNHSVVWACNRIISESIGMIPAVLLQRKGGTKRVCDGLDGNPSHPLYSVMHDLPNEEETATGFTERLTSHCLMQGGGFAQILRRSGTETAVGLLGLMPEQVRPDRERTGARRLVYVVKDGNNQEKTFTVEPGKPQDIFHIRGLGWDGIKGYSVLTMARQSWGTAIGANRNVGRFFANGGRLPYVLEMEGKFRNDTEFEKFRGDWEKTYSDPHKAPILEPPIKNYKQIGISAKDAQLLETRLFDIHEICRWFLVSPHLVGDLSRATFSNIEQLALEFVKMTLSTWLNRWEQEFSRCVLTAQERAQGYFLRHNVNALLRGDFQTRMAGYSTMLQNGIASVNEVRDLEDWNPIDGGDEHHIQLNMQTLPGGTPTQAQAGLVKLGKKPDAALVAQE